MAVTEFILVSFIAPAVPGAISLPTPTLDLLASPTITLPAETQIAGAITSETPIETTATISAFSAGCVPGQVQIVIPENGEDVRGVIPVVGTANTENFGFYKFEIKRTDEVAWLTIQAGNLRLITASSAIGIHRASHQGITSLHWLLWITRRIHPNHVLFRCEFLPLLKKPLDHKKECPNARD